MNIDGKQISFSQAQIDLMRLYREFTLEGRNKYIFDVKYTLDFTPENNKSYLDIIKKEALDNTLKKATPESIAANEKDKAQKPNPLNPFDFLMR